MLYCVVLLDISDIILTHVISRSHIYSFYISTRVFESVTIYIDSEASLPLVIIIQIYLSLTSCISHTITGFHYIYILIYSYSDVHDIIVK